MTSTRRVGIALMVSGLVLGHHREAFADAQACAASAEEGQRGRAAGRLREASQKLVACSQEECPAVIREDCMRWAAQVAEILPSIIVDARDENGHDIADVTVTADGEVLTRKLDGKAIPIDPGPHRIVFERSGAAAVTEDVIVKEGARGRVFSVKLGKPTAPTAVSDPAEGGAPRTHTVLPWVVVGLGGALVIGGVVVIFTSPSLPIGCSSDNATCAKDPTGRETDAAFKTRQETAGRAKGQPVYGAIGVGAGALLVGAGLLWHLLEPTGPAKTARVHFTPWSSATAGGLTADGTF